MWIWLRNILWLPSGRFVIDLFAYCHFSVFIDSDLFQVLLSQCHRYRALVLLGRFLDMGSWAVDLVYLSKFESLPLWLTLLHIVSPCYHVYVFTREVKILVGLVCWNIPICAEASANNNE